MIVEPNPFDFAGWLESIDPDCQNMINEKKVVAVLPAYNAEKTLARTVSEIPNAVDVCILVDDHSTDGTAALARKLGLEVHEHASNRGYGGNQKTCYAAALNAGADIVVMLHPDYQYSPLLVEPMASMIAYGVYDLVLGSRILGGGALSGGMPVYKYISNRVLTLVQNLALGAKLSEYHTGFRAYSRDMLLSLPLHANSEDFALRQPTTCPVHLPRRQDWRSPLAPPAISPRLLQSTCAAAWSTASVCLKPPSTA